MAGERMTYCLSIMTQEGLVMASDSRTNAGYDDPERRARCILLCNRVSGSSSRW